MSSQLISAEDLRDINLAVRVEEGEVISWEPESGYADPSATTYRFASAATALGVDIQEETRAIRVLTEGDRVTGVETSRGVIVAPVVVIIAGARANQLLEPLGIDFGVYPRMSGIAVFRWSQERSGPHPTFIVHAQHTWGRPIDGTSTLAGAETGPPMLADTESSSEAVTQDYIDFTRQHAARRIPSIRRSTMRGNWAGILMGSPDSRPVIGALERFDGLYCMTGDNGSSFKTAPAIGKCVSELILGGEARTVDLTPFPPSRTAEGKPWADEFDYNLVDASVSR